MFTVPKSLAALLSVCSMVGPLSANTYMPGLTAIGQEFAVSEVATYQTLSGYLMTFALSSLFLLSGFALRKKAVCDFNCLSFFYIQPICYRGMSGISLSCFRTIKHFNGRHIHYSAVFFA